MEDNKNLILDIKDLVIHYETDDGVVEAVNGIDIQLEHGKTLGLVGETGSGKTTTALSILRLVPDPPGVIKNGSILLDGKDILNMPQKELEAIRGNTVSMIFQDPMTALNPLKKIGYHMIEVLRRHQNLSKAEARKVAIDMLGKVGIPSAESRMDQYPHEFSGGMRQRVMIAMALCCQPRLLIADEPTTALDVTIQAQILDLLRDIKQKINGSIMLITHDLGVIAEMADYVVVMYAGRVIEQGTAAEIFKNPLHPYTIGLQKSKPVVNQKVDRLYSIPGSVPNPVDMPDYCYFRDRCDRRCPACDGKYPETRTVSGTHRVACHLYRDVSEESAKGGKA